jgi:hypothetical protein
MVRNYAPENLDIVLRPFLTISKFRVTAKSQPFGSLCLSRIWGATWQG